MRSTHLERRTYYIGSGNSGEGSSNISTPSSTTQNNIVVFGPNGETLHDSGVSIADFENLGTPVSNNQILSSQTDGTRQWVDNDPYAVGVDRNPQSIGTIIANGRDKNTILSTTRTFEAGRSYQFELGGNIRNSHTGRYSIFDIKIAGLVVATFRFKNLTKNSEVFYFNYIYAANQTLTDASLDVEVSAQRNKQTLTLTDIVIKIEEY